KNRELIERQIVGTREQIAKHEGDKAKLAAQKEELRGRLDAAVARLSELEQEMADRGGEEAKQLKEKLDGLRIERARATDGIETSKETLKQLRTENADATKEKGKVQKETDALARERENVDKRVGELDGQIKAADKDLHEVDELASKSDAKVLNIQKQIIALNNEIDQVEEKVKGLVLEGDRTKEAMTRLESEIALLEESRKQYQVEHEDADWQLKELHSSTKESGKSLEKLQEDFHSRRAEETRLAKEQAELQTAILSLTRQYAQLKAEADVAENMKRGYTSAVSAILECRETGSIKGIHGTVAQLAHVETQYETAIVTAAGARMQAIIVDDDTVAAQCIDYLKKRKVGREMERSTVKFGPTAASEMEKIAEKLREAQAQGETVANRLDELRKEILGLEETIKDTGGRTGAVEVKTSTLEAKRKEFAAKL